MPSLKDVELKITGVKKTRQITKAMNMVASAKLRSAQDRIERFRPYADKFYSLLTDLSRRADGDAHPLLEVRSTIQHTAIVLITSDRGLCGSFNSNLIKAAQHTARQKQEAGRQVSFYCIGKKGGDAMGKEGHRLAMHKTDAMGNFDFLLASDVGLEIINSYLAAELDEVVLIYGQFHTMAKQEPVVLDILPVVAQDTPQDLTQSTEATGEYIYEPDVAGLLAALLPRFIKVQFYRGMLDTSCSEHAARMTAMDNATRACDDMVEALTLLYNKTRQAAITRDLMDIVGGAEALKG